MNHARIHFQLLEAKVDLNCLIDIVDKGNLTEYDDLSLALGFQQILEHMCLAWHYRYMSNSDISSMSQEEFDLLSSKVPNFACLFHMDD